MILEDKLVLKKKKKVQLQEIGGRFIFVEDVVWVFGQFIVIVKLDLGFLLFFGEDFVGLDDYCVLLFLVME